MPLPKKAPGETKEDFIQRCMDDETMKRDFPDEAQRYAICYSRGSVDAEGRFEKQKEQSLQQNLKN
jgi:hypothetical protein